MLLLEKIPSPLANYAVSPNGGEEGQDNIAMLDLCEEIYAMAPQHEAKLIEIVDKTNRMFLGCDRPRWYLIEAAIQMGTPEKDQVNTWVTTILIVLDAALDD